MTGFNKVADNSFPNAIAFLMGKKANEELSETGLYYDEWPLIWKDFKKQVN
jgi:hypothetical protein